MASASKTRRRRCCCRQQQHCQNCGVFSSQHSYLHTFRIVWPHVLHSSPPDLCSSDDLPEIEICSLLEEQIPKYKIRADALTQFGGYENQVSVVAADRCVLHRFLPSFIIIITIVIPYSRTGSCRVPHWRSRPRDWPWTKNRFARRSTISVSTPRIKINRICILRKLDWGWGL